jgi:hypothetical protein
MPTTTNYGWTTPADTDLVKDGAAAIRTLGSSIDTTLKTQIDAQIPDSLLTTKGDLIAATGASTPARLGVGTNDQVLIADSTAATGLKWGTPAAGSMTLLSTTSLSGSSTTISSISQGYKHLFIVFYAVNVSANNSVKLRPNNATTGWWTAGNQGSTDVNTANEDINVWTTAIQGTTATNAASITLHNYSSAVVNKTFQNSGFFTAAGTGGVYTGVSVSGGSNTSSAISSLVIAPGGGTFTGTVLLYGVN